MKMPKLSAHLRYALLLVFLAGCFLTASAQKRYRVGYKDSGFSLIIEPSVLIPSNTYSIGFNFNAIAGAQMGPNVFLGAGIGLDAYESDLFVPAFADFRYFFIADQWTPYLYVDAGYALPVDADPILSGGPMITPGAGLKYFLTNTVALNLALGYRFQSMPVDAGDSDEASVALRTNWIQSAAVRLGLQF